MSTKYNTGAVHFTNILTLRGRWIINEPRPQDGKILGTASVWLVLGLFHVLKASAALKTNLLALAMLYNPLRSVLDTLTKNDGLISAFFTTCLIAGTSRKVPGWKDTRNFVKRCFLRVRAPINVALLIIMRTRKLIARNAHAITRCARVIRVRKSAYLNESERNYAYFSTRVSQQQT